MNIFLCIFYMVKYFLSNLLLAVSRAELRDVEKKLHKSSFCLTSTSVLFQASVCMVKAEDARSLAGSTELFIRQQKLTASVAKVL